MGHLAKFYAGLRPQDDQWEIFNADNPDEATVDVTGYEDVRGPFDTFEEAEEYLL